MTNNYKPGDSIKWKGKKSERRTINRGKVLWNEPENGKVVVTSDAASFHGLKSKYAIPYERIVTE